MFLSLLNESEKNLFIDLAIKAAEANGIVALEEKNMLKAFAMEMNIEPRYSSEIEFNELLLELVELSSQKERRIVLFELIGLLISDEEFDDKEKEFLNEISCAFHITDIEKERLFSLVTKYMLLYKEISNEVIGKIL